jgi:hypothetical protein
MTFAPRSSLRALLGAVALAPTADAGVAAADEAEPCAAMEVEYRLSGTLELSDTPMGKANGTYRVGPGTAVIRYERDGSADAARMVAYDMSEHFTIQASALFWSTHLTTNATTRVSTDSCGVVASGVLSGRSLEWRSSIRGTRTDGTVTCDGSLCGKFGAPRSGTSSLHLPPQDVRFQPWVFGADGTSFTMGSSWMGHTERPAQTSRMTLSGRAVRRSCVMKVSTCTAGP